MDALKKNKETLIVAVKEDSLETYAEETLCCYLVTRTKLKIMI
jgi:hypothetical protein